MARDLKITSYPPHTVNVSWREPVTPNGIVRYYIVGYMLADGSGTKMVFDYVKGLSQMINNLRESTKYRVTVQAFTVGVGPAASITFELHAISKLYLADTLISWHYMYWCFAYTSTNSTSACKDFECDIKFSYYWMGFSRELKRHSLVLHCQYT